MDETSQSKLTVITNSQLKGTQKNDEIAFLFQIAMLLDPNSTIIKAHGKYAGPLAETEVIL